MKRKSASGLRGDNLRKLVASEAARIMSEQGIEDFLLAKRKAAQRLGLSDRGSLPRNTEIEAALAEQQRLFAGEDHHDLILQLRDTALNAMRLFERFSPRLVGPVLSGLVTPTSDVELHVFAESAEQVALCLIQQDIPHRLTEKRIRTHADRYQYFPVYRFEAGDTTIDLTVFPTNGIRQAPLSPVDGRPMPRGTPGQVSEMLGG